MLVSDNGYMVSIQCQCYSFVCSFIYPHGLVCIQMKGAILNCNEFNEISRDNS